jgi:hypothetical protein
MTDKYYFVQIIIFTVAKNLTIMTFFIVVNNLILSGVSKIKTCINIDRHFNVSNKQFFR